MTEDRGWPDSLPVGAVRFARRMADLDASVRFCRDLVGLPLLVSFDADDGPDTFAGAVFGMPGTAVTFELVESATPFPIDDHEQIVLYLAGPTQRDKLADRWKGAGLMPCTQYRYWDDNDAVTFRDPDGREIVFAPWVFGSAPAPARLKSQTNT